MFLKENMIDGTLVLRPVSRLIDNNVSENYMHLRRELSLALVIICNELEGIVQFAFFDSHQML